MRRLVVALIVATVAFSLVGCGGGEEPVETTDAAASSDAAAASAAAPTAEEDDSLGLSPVEEQVYEPFPTDPEMVPPSILAHIAAKQPMIVWFNDGTESVTQEQKNIIDEVIEDRTGLIDDLGYDIGKYVSTETSTGAIVVDPAQEDQPIQKQAIALAQYLDIGSTPYILIVDEYGYITWRARGFIDEGTLEVQMERLFRAEED